MPTPDRARLTELQEVMKKAEAESQPVFVPNLAELGFTSQSNLESAAGPGRTLPTYGAVLKDICGATDDSQDVEQYDGTLGVAAAFVAARQSAAGQVQWNDGLASVFTNPGNVSGARWGSGTMITAPRSLSAQARAAVASPSAQSPPGAALGVTCHIARGLRPSRSAARNPLPVG